MNDNELLLSIKSDEDNNVGEAELSFKLLYKLLRLKLRTIFSPKEVYIWAIDDNDNNYNIYVNVK